MNFGYKSKKKLENNIQIVNKLKHIETEYDFYIGRPSVLSNPYSHNKNSKYAKYFVNTRKEAINEYELYFNDKIKTNTKFSIEIDKMLEIYNKYGKLNLVCFCYPKSCHGDILKKYLMNIL